MYIHEQGFIQDFSGGGGNTEAGGMGGAAPPEAEGYISY